MPMEHAGPGGVSNVYGARETTSKEIYDNQDKYQDVFIPTDSLPVVGYPVQAGWELKVGGDTVSVGGGSSTNLTSTSTATTVTVESSTGTDVTLAAATTSVAGVFPAADKTKLNGIATGATANSTDAALRDRSTHTGTQTASTISDFNTAADARIGAASVNALADVTVTSPTTGQVLKWNGSAWINDTDSGGAGATNLSVVTSATTLTVYSDTGTDAVLPVATASLSGVLSAADKTKLDGVATGATNTPLSSTTPAALGTAAVGVGTTVARADHVHALPAAATTSVAGLMSAADKTKLDGVATGATALSLSSTTPAALGTAAVGVGTTAARADHVHQAPTTITGNAGTATALATARTISVSGDVTGSVSFNGTANADIVATVVDNSHNHTVSTITNFTTSVDARIAAQNLDVLADVNTAGAATGNVLQYNGTAWVPAAPSGGSSVAYPKTRFVSTTGNDGTAVLGDITKPYLNVKTAVDACVAGDAVVLLPGAHTGVAPLILKNGCTLTSFLGRPFTSLTFAGTFGIQGGTGPATHGAQIQPSTGTQGVDICYVSDLKIEVLMPVPAGTYAALTGVNTATGTDVVGSGATYADMRVTNCDLIGISDVHFVIDAKQRTYFKDCYVESSFDWCHLIGPNNIASCEFDNCKMVWRPWYDLVNNVGAVLAGWWRVRSGELTLKGCNVEIWNDGRTNWTTYGIGAGDQCGGVVDDFAGATVRILGGLPFRYLGAAFPIPILPRFGSTGTVGGLTSGVIIVDQAIEGLCDYNADSFSGTGTTRAAKVVPLNDMTLKATVFAGTVTGKRNTTYKCDAAAVSQTFPMLAIPANTVVKRAWMVVKTPFAGGAGTVTTLEVGTSASSIKHLGATTIRTAGVTMGSAVYSTETTGDTLTTAGTLLQIVVRNTGANVSTLTSGEVDVYVELAGTPL